MIVSDIKEPQTTGLEMNETTINQCTFEEAAKQIEVLLLRVGIRFPASHTTTAPGGTEFAGFLRHI